MTGGRLVRGGERRGEAEIPGVEDRLGVAETRHHAPAREKGLLEPAVALNRQEDPDMRKRRILGQIPREPERAARRALAGELTVDAQPGGADESRPLPGADPLRHVQRRGKQSGAKCRRRGAGDGRVNGRGRRFQRRAGACGGGRVGLLHGELPAETLVVLRLEILKLLALQRHACDAHAEHVFARAGHPCEFDRLALVRSEPELAPGQGFGLGGQPELQLDLDRSLERLREVRERRTPHHRPHRRRLAGAHGSGRDADAVDRDVHLSAGRGRRPPCHCQSHECRTTRMRES